MLNIEEVARESPEKIIKVHIDPLLGLRDFQTRDIAAGIDRQVSSWMRIGDQFPRAVFGIAAGVTDPESGSTISGSPLKLGGSTVLSFGPDGASTSGTIYLRGPAAQQYAVRLLGATGRCRLLRFDFRNRRWVAA